MLWQGGKNQYGAVKTALMLRIMFSLRPNESPLLLSLLMMFLTNLDAF